MPPIVRRRSSTLKTEAAFEELAHILEATEIPPHENNAHMDSLQPCGNMEQSSSSPLPPSPLRQQQTVKTTTQQPSFLELKKTTTLPVVRDPEHKQKAEPRFSPRQAAYQASWEQQLLLADRWYSRWLISPLANVAGQSLVYQMYLNEIFHTNFMYPLTCFFILCAASGQRLWGEWPATRELSLLEANFGLVLALGLIAWYILWGYCQKSPSFGFLPVPFVMGMWVMSNVYIGLFRDLETASGEWSLGAFLAPTPLAYNPLLWAFVFSWLQAISHGFEPYLPPRVNSTTHWVRMSDFLRARGWKGFVSLLLMMFPGAIDEFFASPRLLPILALRLAFLLGHNPEQWREIKELTAWSTKYGNPAVDFIGRGGALQPLSSSPSSSDVDTSSLPRQQHPRMPSTPRTSHRAPPRMAVATDGSLLLGRRGEHGGCCAMVE
ncbi:Glycerophosphocholine acyltransferase 1 [Balamuthia mandrillaris]